MSEPTLRDVVELIEQVRTDLGAQIRAVDAKVDAVDAKVDGVRTDLAEFRSEMRDGFAEVNKVLVNHVVVTHMKLDEEIADLKKRLDPPPAAPRGARRAG